uniref:Uncharacterized protein n=1 Tax=Glossina palpalis gambiensis TaxID=67801 RepID=A0A1B0C4M3_9MUSC
MKIAERTDARVGIMNELVQGIQVSTMVFTFCFHLFVCRVILAFTFSGNRKRYKCEGSLISASYVITVSHYVSGRLSLLKWHLTGVRSGEWNSEENSDCKNGKNANTSCASRHINVAIEYTVQHSLYSLKAKNQLHDIVLLRLADHTFDRFYKAYMFAFK